MTVSSDGLIRLFDLSSVPGALVDGAMPVEIECISSYDTKGTRLTCVAFTDLQDSRTADIALGKRKRAAGDLGENEDEDVSDAAEENENEDSGDESDSA